MKSILPYLPIEKTNNILKTLRPTKINRVIVYTDGACSRNGLKSAKAGIGVYWGNNDPRNVSERLLGRATNNRAEIHAAIEAIKEAKRSNIGAITIRTDSEFLCNAVSKWMVKWKKNGWKKSSGKPIINLEDFKELDFHLKDIDVIFEKIKAHSNDLGNQEADKLATRATYK